MRQPHEHMIYGQSSQPGYAAGTLCSLSASFKSMLHYSVGGDILCDTK